MYYTRKSFDSSTTIRDADIWERPLCGKVYCTVTKVAAMGYPWPVVIYIAWHKIPRTGKPCVQKLQEFTATLKKVYSIIISHHCQCQYQSLQEPTSQVPRLVIKPETEWNGTKQNEVEKIVESVYSWSRMRLHAGLALTAGRQ